MWKLEIDGTTIAVSKDPLKLVDSAKELLAKRMGFSNSNSLKQEEDWKYVSKRFYTKFTETYIEGTDEYYNVKVSYIEEI